MGKPSFVVCFVTLNQGDLRVTCRRRERMFFGGVTLTLLCGGFGRFWSSGGEVCEPSGLKGSSASRSRCWSICRPPEKRERDRMS